MEQRGRILGIGGVFFKSANRDPMREWYAKHLGLADKGSGAMLPWREHDDPQKEHVTVWSVFPASTDYSKRASRLIPNEWMSPTVALPGSMIRMGTRLSSGSRPPSPREIAEKI